MDVLVIGGSVFVGRAVVAQALELGARVTVFNRGRSGPADPRVDHLRGDRSKAADLEQLRGRRFDVVVDTCGYEPVQVRDSAELLAPTCGNYAFVSSINAYPGWPDQADYRAGGCWDGDPDSDRGHLPAEVTERISYGWLKVGCERAVERAFGPDRTAVLRAGCIVGPEDSAVGRLPWWLDRVARGGEVLVPGRPDDPISLIDAGDLAAFALSGAAGTFDCGGPAGRDTRGGFMTAAGEVTGSHARFTWIDGEWLNERAQSWTEVPLWAPEAEAPGTWAHDSTAAEAAGLTYRPLRETIDATWAWQRQLDWAPTEHTPGLAPSREAELLAEWAAR